MPTYFNYLTQKQESIETALDFYLISCGEELLELKVSPEGVDEIVEDKTTGEKQFWFITREQIYARLAILFPDDKPKTPFNKQEILREFGIALNDSNLFSVAPIRRDGLNPLSVSSSSIANVLAKRYAVKALLSVDPNRISEHYASLPLSSTDRLTARYAIMAFARLSVSMSIVNRASVSHESNVMKSLISPLSSTDEQTTYYAAFAFAFFSNVPESHAAIHEANAIKLLIPLLSSLGTSIAQFAATVIANLSANIIYHELIVESNCLRSLQSLRFSSDKKTRDIAEEALNNLRDYSINSRGIQDSSTGCQLAMFSSDFYLNKSKLIVPVAKRATTALHVGLFQPRSSSLGVVDNASSKARRPTT